MLRLFRLIRISDWWLNIVPRYLGIIYILILCYRLPLYSGFKTLFLFFSVIIFTASFAYLLNEVTDLKDDLKAGKNNSTVQLKQATKLFYLLFFFILSFFPWLFLPVTKLNFSLFCLQFLLLTLYSLKPFRLKRFPIPGVILDAFYNNVVILFVIITTLTIIADRSRQVNCWLMAVVFAWAFIKGLRGILLHQVSDRKPDLIANNRTLVTKFGPMKTVIWINRIILPLEIISFISVVLVLSLSGIPFLWLIFPLFGIYLFCFFRLWERKIPWRRREAKFRYLYIFNDLYEEWIPIIVLFYLPFLNLWYTLLIPIHLLFFNKIVKKIIRNSEKVVNNFTQYKEFLRYRRYDLKKIYHFETLQTMLTPDNLIVHGLWTGNELSILELLTINSFIRNGHEFHLWVYENIKNLPEKVVLRDANLIIQKGDIIIRKYNDPVTGVGKGSVGAPFSDIFRYKLLYEYGGWWVDMDVTCLKPLQFNEPYFFRSHLLLDVIGNVMKCPKRSELMLRTFIEAKENCDENTLDWLLPNKILNKHIKELDLLQFRKNDISNRDEWPETKKYIRRLIKIPDKWYFIHWSNEEWRMNRLDRNHLRLKNTTLGFLIEKFDVSAAKSSFMNKLKNDLRLANPFKKVYWFFHGHVKYYVDTYFRGKKKK
jgi:4-hydroxybenzoate polyprenyltransferase